MTTEAEVYVLLIAMQFHALENNIILKRT